MARAKENLLLDRRRRLDNANTKDLGSARSGAHTKRAHKTQHQTMSSFSYLLQTKRQVPLLHLTPYEKPK